MNAVLAVPSSEMNDDLKNCLHQLSLHFACQGTTCRGKKTKPGSRSAPCNSWQAVLNLTALDLSSKIKEILNRPEVGASRAADFLNDGQLLKIQGGVLDRAAAGQGLTNGDVFIACYAYATHLEKRRKSDNIRWCFTMIFFMTSSELSALGVAVVLASSF